MISPASASDPVAALQRQLADLQELLAWRDLQQQQQHEVLAAEVHDQLGSALTALTMRLALIERQSHVADDARRAEQWLKSQSLLKAITQTARRIQHQLQPNTLTSLGLHAILTDYLDAFSSRTGTPCTLAVSGPEPDLSPVAVQGLFNLLQEGISNIERHAGPCEVKVRLSNADQQCRLTIEDNGRGFDLAGLDWQCSHGLRLMRERAARLPARLDLHSQVQMGCRINIALTLPA
ncbi:MAG: signal transduction histidine kinase [Bradyrhizobium sp.]|jgi:signal transduction histidine kinase